MLLQCGPQLTLGEGFTDLGGATFCSARVAMRSAVVKDSLAMTGGATAAPESEAVLTSGDVGNGEC